MDAKTFFMSVRDAERRIKILDAKRDKYMDMATSVGAFSETNIRSTDHRSRVESAAVGLADMVRDVEVEAEACLTLIRQAEELIAKIDRPRYREVLELRYLAGLKWPEVAEKMEYVEVSSALHMHGWALIAAQKILDRA